jgi:hypothetical protein
MTLEPGTPVALFQTRIVGATNTVGLNYDVTRDGADNTVAEAAASPITLHKTPALRDIHSFPLSVRPLDRSRPTANGPYGGIPPTLPLAYIPSKICNIVWAGACGPTPL